MHVHDSLTICTLLLRAAQRHMSPNTDAREALEMLLPALAPWYHTVYGCFYHTKHTSSHGQRNEHRGYCKILLPSVMHLEERLTVSQSVSQSVS